MKQPYSIQKFVCRFLPKALLVHKQFIFSLLLLTSVLFIHAQKNKFSKVYYDNQKAAGASAVVQTFDKGYLIAGENSYSGMGELLKIDSSGTILWNKEIKNPKLNGNCSLSNIMHTNDSCCALTGFVVDNVNNYLDLLCIKINSKGDTIWSRAFDFGVSCIGTSVCQASDSGYVITGYLNLNSKPYSKIIVVKLGATGVFKWGQSFTVGSQESRGYSVKELPDSGYIVTGSYENYPPFDANAFLLKVSSTGALAWCKKYNLPTPVNFSAYDLQLTTNGIIFYSSVNGQHVGLTKTDFSGTVLWSKKYMTGSGLQGSGRPKLKKTLTGGCVLTTSNFLLVTDSVGDLLFSRYMFLYAIDAIQASDKGFFVLGNGPVFGVKTPNSTNPQIGVVKTDSLGRNKSFCISDSPVNFSADTLSSSTVSLTTNTISPLKLSQIAISDVGLSTDTGCVAFLGGVHSMKNDEGIVVYPNPNKGYFNLEADPSSSSELKNLSIYNILGEQVFQSAASEVIHSTIDISTEPDGIYFLQIYRLDKISTQKIIVTH